MSPEAKGALDSLRRLRSPTVRREEESAWREIDGTLRQFAGRVPVNERDDVHQRALLKVHRSAAGFDGDTEAEARSWLRTVYRSAVSEHFRLRGRAHLVQALAREGEGSIEDLPAPLTSHFTQPEVLDRLLSWVLQRVEVVLDAQACRPSKRLGDLRRAQVALLANVRGLTHAELRHAMDLDTTTPSDAALSKWIERGRETVLLPAIADWDDPVAPPLREILTGARRSDAGKARKVSGHVSPRRPVASSLGDSAEASLSTAGPPADDLSKNDA